VAFGQGCPGLAAVGLDLGEQCGGLGESGQVHAGVKGRGGGFAERVVLMVQRLEREKNTDIGLRIFAHSGLAQQGWRLDIAGDGSQRDRLNSMANGLGVGAACRFLGRRSDVPYLLARSALLLAPCPVDGFGLSVVEAMAAGLPVVAAAGGGHLETVGAVADPALFPPEDLAAAAGMLGALAADPPRRGAYGTRLQEAQRRDFTVDRQIDATLDVYKSVLK
jgi:glycosyltransferase involved in cell wall biosynthesis